MGYLGTKTINVSSKKEELEDEVNAKREGSKGAAYIPTIWCVNEEIESMHQGESMDGSRVRILTLVTHQKWLATHRGNTPSKKIWVEENEKALEDIKLK